MRRVAAEIFRIICKKDCFLKGVKCVNIRNYYHWKLVKGQITNQSKLGYIVNRGKEEWKRIVKEKTLVHRFKVLYKESQQFKGQPKQTRPTKDVLISLLDKD